MRGSGDGQAGQGDRAVRLIAWVDGWVQGVGFRWWVRDKAAQLGLAGSATNLPDGRVQVVAEGPESACRRLLGDLGGGRTPGRVTGVMHRWDTAKGDLDGFAER